MNTQTNKTTTNEIDPEMKELGKNEIEATNEDKDSGASICALFAAAGFTDDTVNEDGTLKDNFQRI